MCPCETNVKMVNTSLVKMHGLFSGMHGVGIKGGRPSIASNNRFGLTRAASAFGCKPLGSQSKPVFPTHHMGRIHFAVPSLEATVLHAQAIHHAG